MSKNLQKKLSSSFANFLQSERLLPERMGEYLKNKLSTDLEKLPEFIQEYFTEPKVLSLTSAANQDIVPSAAADSLAAIWKISSERSNSTSASGSGASSILPSLVQGRSKSSISKLASETGLQAK